MRINRAFIHRETRAIEIGPRSILRHRLIVREKLVKQLTEASKRNQRNVLIRLPYVEL